MQHEKVTSQFAPLYWHCASSHYFTMGRDHNGGDILRDTRQGYFNN